MRVPAVLIAAVVAVMTAMTPPASAAPSSPGQHNVTFGAGPASTSKAKGHHTAHYAIDGRPYYTFLASPGGALNDHIGIINFAHKKQVLSVYPVDATTATNGDFTYSSQAVTPTGAGAWLAVGTPQASGQIVVKPRSRTFLPIHLRVPPNAQPGDHAAAVVVSLTGLVKGKSGQRVNLEQRVATRVIIRVSGELHPQLSVNNLHVAYSGTDNPIGKGSATLTYTVTNTGNVLLGAAQQVEVKGLFGTTKRAALAGIPALLPGGSFPVTTTVPDVLPELHMSASVHLTPEGLRGDVNPGVRSVTASTSFWAVPWVLVAVVVVLASAMVLEVRRRRRRKRVAGRVPAASTSGPGTAIGEGATT